MRVKFLTTYAGPTITAAAGIEKDIPDELAKSLAKSGAVTILNPEQSSKKNSSAAKKTEVSQEAPEAGPVDQADENVIPSSMVG